MRVLHLGNIAGNGYQNAKFQRRKGIEAYVLSYNYHYCIGQPEWEDGEFEGPITNEDFPDWPAMNVRNFERPAWFDDITTLDIRFTLEAALEALVLQQPSVLRKKLYRFLDRLLSWKHSSNNTAADRFNALFGLSSGMILAPEHARVINCCMRLYARTYGHLPSSLSPSDVLTYMRETPEYRKVLAGYDVIQAYSTDTIHTMLVQNGRPFIAFDHGNMREIPWEDTARGRMLQLSYQAAFWIFLTNPDTVKSAKNLKLDRYSFLPHPVDDTRFQPTESSELRESLKSRYQCEAIWFAPARHNWELKGNDIMIRAFERVGRRLNAVLIFCDWGQEMDKSRALIDELKLSDRIVWIPPVGKMKLRDYYNASDLVLDQFTLGVFGSTAPEVMACARPVVIYFNPAYHEWCFEEMPPVLHARTVDQLTQVLETVGADPASQQAVGQKGRAWFLKYHSWDRVAGQQLAKYREMLGQ